MWCVRRHFGSSNGFTFVAIVLSSLAVPPSPLSGIAVRHGHTVAHVCCVGDAAALMLELSAGPPVQDVAHMAQPTVLDIASSAANAALDLVSRPCGLTGKATKNLGTALRSKPVRSLLEGVLTEPAISAAARARLHR